MQIHAGVHDAPQGLELPLGSPLQLHSLGGDLVEVYSNDILIGRLPYTVDWLAARVIREGVDYKATFGGLHGDKFQVMIQWNY